MRSSTPTRSNQRKYQDHLIPTENSSEHLAASLKMLDASFWAVFSGCSGETSSSSAENYRLLPKTLSDKTLSGVPSIRQVVIAGASPFSCCPDGCKEGWANRWGALPPTDNWLHPAAGGKRGIGEQLWVGEGLWGSLGLFFAEPLSLGLCWRSSGSATIQVSAY